MDAERVRDGMSFTVDRIPGAVGGNQPVVAQIRYADTDRGIARLGPDGTVTRPFGDSLSRVALMQVLPGGRHALAVRTPQGVGAGALLLDPVAPGSRPRTQPHFPIEDFPTAAGTRQHQLTFSGSR